MDPRDKSCENLISYSREGKVIPKIDNDIEVQYDIGCVLNLNHSKLIQFRKNILDLAIEQLRKGKKDGAWTKDYIQSQIDKWNAKDKEGKLKAFYKVAVWILEEYKKKDKYY